MKRIVLILSILSLGAGLAACDKIFPKDAVDAGAAVPSAAPTVAPVATETALTAAPLESATTVLPQSRVVSKDAGALKDAAASDGGGKVDAGPSDAGVVVVVVDSGGVPIPVPTIKVPSVPTVLVLPTAIRIPTTLPTALPTAWPK